MNEGYWPAPSRLSSGQAMLAHLHHPPHQTGRQLGHCVNRWVSQHSEYTVVGDLAIADEIADTTMQASRTHPAVSSLLAIPPPQIALLSLYLKCWSNFVIQRGTPRGSSVAAHDGLTFLPCTCPITRSIKEICVILHNCFLNFNKSQTNQSKWELNIKMDFKVILSRSSPGVTFMSFSAAAIFKWERFLLFCYYTITLTRKRHLDYDLKYHQRYGSKDRTISWFSLLV